MKRKMPSDLVFPTTFRFLPFLLLLALFFSSSLVQATMSGDTTITGSVFCDTKCNARCAKAGYRDRCLKYCGICCKACHCVPSGTYGHKDECPCYRDMVSGKGTPKCP